MRLARRMAGLGVVALALLVALWPGGAAAQGPDATNEPQAGGVQQDWVAFYNNGDSDLPGEMALDAAGNVVVTGASWGTFHDFATVKYDTNGTELWVRRYNGPGNKYDEAVGVTLDAAGNVYVTGHSEDAQGVEDFVTIKYDASGTQLWARRYNGPANGADLAADVAVDSAGNVYVTGWSYSTSGAADYLTLKYDSAGTQLWAARTTGTGANQDYAFFVRVDGAGNVYVAGEIVINFSANYRDFGIVKYNASGAQQWLATYTSPISPGSLDTPTAMEIDAAGNVYVTGDSGGQGPGCCPHDWATLKFDTNGALLWAQRLDGPAHGQDIPTDLVVDSQGNVAVTGQITTSTTNIGLAKYSNSGQRLWVRVRDERSFDEAGEALAVDGAGNLYVTGYRHDEPDNNYNWVTLKYSASGQPQWRILFNGLSNFIDSPTTIALDAANRVYVFGQAWNGLPDFATIRYSQQ